MGSPCNTKPEHRVHMNHEFGVVPSIGLLIPIGVCCELMEAQEARELVSLAVLEQGLCKRDDPR